MNIGALLVGSRMGRREREKRLRTGIHSIRNVRSCGEGGKRGVYGSC